MNPLSSNTPIRVILTGATGMVGEGVLLTCLDDPRVEAVLVINRRPCERVHPKLKEVLHSDFYDFSAIESELSDYNACFFCLGTSSVGMQEPEYYKVTYELTLALAAVLSRLNPDMTFCYVSGRSTDSTEEGRVMWARVKGKTENALMRLPFRQVYAFRPAFMKAVPGQKRLLSLYKYLSWIYPIGRAFWPGPFMELREVGRAMINSVLKGYPRQVLEAKDILALGKEA